MASASAVSLPGLMKKCLSASRAGAVAVRVDGVELRAVAPRFHDERPQVHVGAEDVGAPGEDQLRVAELLGLGAVADAQRLGQAGAAGGGADGAVEPRRAQAVEEAAVHAGAVEQAHGAGVAVGQDGFRAELGGDGVQARGDGVERFVPGDALEAAFAFGARRGAADRAGARGEYSRSRYCATLPHRKPRVTGCAGSPRSLRAAAVFDGDQQGAAVRAIERADGMADFSHLNDYIVGRSMATDRLRSPRDPGWRESSG